MIRHYCDECVNFRPGNPGKKLCALGKILSFKAPKDMTDISFRNWGHYKEDCKDFKKEKDD